MGKIKLLEEHIADKIAAGEVVERPLSVVKELLENSLDAGADLIEVEIRDGGTRLIRIRDNGSGMDGDDLQLAFQRHATSKISSFQDLYRLTTFGFRGEALPSIAAVSQVEMTSCVQDAAVGHRLRIDGGTVQEFGETSTANGTIIEVKNLFYNIPARRKFLKSNSYEAGLIADLVSKYAIGHPDVRFRYVSNGQVQLDTAGLSTTEQRMAYVYGSNLEPLLVTVPAQELRPGCTLEACLLREEITRNNRNQEVFFVNGRLVRSAALSQTLEESYYTLIAKGRFPVALVKLTIPGSELDVNIHPAKTEIKINQFEQLKPLLIERLKDQLWEASITKNAFLAQPEQTAPNKEAQKAAPAQKSPAQAVRKTEQKEYPVTSKRILEGQKQLADIVAEPEKLLQYQPQPVKAPARAAEKQPVQADLFEVAEQPKPQEKAKPQLQAQKTEAVAQFKKPAQTEMAEAVAKGQMTEGDAVEVKGLKNLQVIGQLNNSFILAQNEEGLYIIDQHTCHERILYEKFMAAEDSKEQLSQPLLIPVTVSLSAQQESLLMQHIFTLRELGFVVENFGERCYLLRSLPLGLHELEQAESFFLDLLHDLGSQKEVTPAVIKEKLLITASCKGAVKANWPLTDIEMRTLLHDLSQVDNAHTCPHGRPIIYQITMAELYKIFKRGAYPNK